MKLIFSLAAILLLSVCLMSPANAQQSATPAKPTAGIDWYEKVMRERAIKDRAAEERNAMKQAVRTGKDFKMNGLTLDAYNALILQKNSAK